MTTPSIEPPLVVSGDVRLLIHENVLATFAVGLKKASPELFEAGSMGVSSPRQPIQIGKPGGGSTNIDYRIELDQFTADVAPPDKNADTVPDPFALSASSLALFCEVDLDLWGNEPTSWHEKLTVFTWVKCLFISASKSVLELKIDDVRVTVPGLSNSALLNALNHIFLALLSNAVGGILMPTVVPLQPLGTMRLTRLTLGLNAIDVSAVLN